MVNDSQNKNGLLQQIPVSMELLPVWQFGDWRVSCEKHQFIAGTNEKGSYYSETDINRGLVLLITQFVSLFLYGLSGLMMLSPLIELESIKAQNIYVQFTDL